MGYSSWGQKEFDMTEHTRMYIYVYVYVYTHTHTHISFIKESVFKHPLCWEGLEAGGEGTTEDEMAGWHHRLNGHEFE